MDLRALNEIERVVRQARARFRHIPLMCIDCNKEMEVKYNCAICWQCNTIQPFR